MKLSLLTLGMASVVGLTACGGAEIPSEIPVKVTIETETPSPVVSDGSSQPPAEPSPAAPEVEPAPAPAPEAEPETDRDQQPAPAPEQEQEPESGNPEPAPEVEPEPITEPLPQEPVNNVPAITGVQLLSTDSSPYQSIRVINDGDTIDLGELPYRVNIEAISADPGSTGSVDFQLEGPVSVNRVENNAIYTMADEAHHFDVKAGGLPAGDYTARITPFSGSNGSGEAGVAHVVRFTLEGKPAAEPSVAHDDSYYGRQGEKLTVNASEGVMDNDIIEAPENAEVRIADMPENGSVTVNRNGSFNYQPDHGFHGVDNFTYTLLDENGNEDTAVVTLVISGDAASLGFTPIVASDDTRTVYVSSSEGLDSNDGLSIQAPVRTLDRAFSLVRSGYPDHVLLKRGDVWRDENLNNAKSGRSASEPAVVAFYGESGDRPKLETIDRTISSKYLHHVHFIGLEVEAYKMNPRHPAFDGKTSANLRLVGDFNNLLFEDMKLRFVEFVIQGYDGEWARNIRIRRSMILDKYTASTSYHRNSRPSGIFIDTGEGLTVEESLWDHNGWNAEVVGAGANMYNHNLYLSHTGNVGNKIIVRDNIITRGSALGVHGRPGGLYENNYFARNAIGMQMGYQYGQELPNGGFAYARDNVIQEGLRMGRGIDACSDPAICTAAIWGLQVENLGNADVRVERNIVSNRLFEYSGSVSGIRYDEQAKYSDNIVYRWESQDQGADQGYPDPSRTLADYNASLGGEHSFEAFIERARNRGLQEWDERYTADAINDYIRAGFGR